MYRPAESVPRMSRKRDSGYYRERLRREFPTIYKDLVSGKIATVRQAAIRAGLIRSPTRLDALKREWRRASSAERRAFAAWLRASLPKGETALPPRSPIDGTGRLKKPVVDHIEAWCRSRKKSPGQIMKEMGFSNYDFRLAQALKGAPLASEIVDRLAKWLAGSGLR